MPKFNVSRSVPYSAEQVFAIASDVAHYRYFLPLVKRSVVRNVTELSDGRRTFDGELTVAYKKLSIEEVMVSRVTVDPANLTVTAESSQGPVKRLVAEWKIVATSENRCDINFSVDYELKSRTLQFVLSGMFDMAVRRVMTAFEERARELYGAPAIS
jgi:coenzyme Q-binding protein COQ10